MSRQVMIPRILTDHPMYKNLSAGARVLYGILWSMKREAERNGWVDTNGCRYVILPKKKMQEELGCSRYHIDRAIRELETVDLIKLEYLRSPSFHRKIYVRGFKDQGGWVKAGCGRERGQEGKNCSKKTGRDPCLLDRHGPSQAETDGETLRPYMDSADEEEDGEDRNLPGEDIYDLLGRLSEKGAVCDLLKVTVSFRIPGGRIVKMKWEKEKEGDGERDEYRSSAGAAYQGPGADEKGIFPKGQLLR